MTLQERLREAGLDLSARGWRDSCGSPDCGIASNLANEAALALDAKDERIKELEGALRELSAMYSHAWDMVDGNLLMMSGSIPRFEAAHKRAEEALK